MTPPRCLVKGSLNIDEVFSLTHIVRPGETISSTGLAKKAGGKGANQAAAVARAGGSVELDAAIGDDGVWVKTFLEGMGVDVGRVRIVDDEVTGRAIIQSAADGENSIVLHKGANFHISSSDETPDLSPYSHILLQNEIPLSTTRAFLAASKHSGCTSIFNPSPMLSKDELREFRWKELSWLIVNAGELTDLLQAFGLASSSGADGGRDEAEKDLRTIAASEWFGGEVGVICTLGAQGICYLEAGKDEVGFMPSAKAQKVVDTTGAGDCFAGTFAAGLMRGEALEDVIQTCLVTCAMCVEKAGASESYPSRQDVLRRIGSS